MTMKLNNLKISNISFLTLIILLTSMMSCSGPVKVPEKLISDQTAARMDNFLKNRTSLQIPADDRLVFGYTFQEMEDYMVYLKDIANKTQVSLDSIQFVIAAYPPNPDRDNKVYTAIYLRPTFVSQLDIDKVNKAQVGTITEGETSQEEETYKTILDMSGCCPSDEFISAEKNH